MIASKIVETQWFPDKKLIVTHISGNVDITDVEEWEHSLHSALGQVKDNEVFKIFVNLYGFKATDLAAHKRFRNIIPLTLAQYGWKVGYVDLFEEEAKQLKLTRTRGIRCVGATHCHQDATKIEKYEALYSSEHERFFTDPHQVARWIESLDYN